MNEICDPRIFGASSFESSWPVGQEPAPGGWYAGKQYDDYTKSIHDVLDNFDAKFPQFKDQGYEIAGFVWWQGHKDQNEVHASRYEQNLVNLINAWRKEFDAPDAKFAIATIAFGGWKLAEPGKTIAEAQLAVSGESGRYPQFKGNVKTFRTDLLVDKEAERLIAGWQNHFEEWKKVGSDRPYHYLGSAIWYTRIGHAMGESMLELMGDDAS